MLVILTLLLALAVVSFAPKPATLTSGGNALALKAPSFVAIANAQDEGDAPTAFPQDEAGISAYFHASNAINLADVRSIYRVIEAETSDYLIGSVPPANYPERFDVHVYIHRSGWFLAYYLAADPAAKIFDWNAYTSGSIPTLLENVLAVAANAAGVSYPGAAYYDFRFPNANRLLLAAEDNRNGSQFQVNLPGSYAYYERSWTLRAVQEYSAHLKLDGTEIGSTGDYAFGVLIASQLLPDRYHTCEVWNDYDDLSYAGLALVYRVP
jgi:hypothetical protein